MEIAILDFGSQYTHLIARRIRELGVKSRIYPNNVQANELNQAAGIILSGGPRSIVNDLPLEYDAAIFSLSKPILGLCYGHQLISKHFGGQVVSGQAREYGLAGLNTSDSPIFQNVSGPTTVWMSHGDHVARLGQGFKSIGQTASDDNTAMADENKKIYGFQFHPEVAHTAAGRQMLSNFVFNICQARKNWDADTMLEEIKENIIRQAGGKNVFLLLSGGVDSTVCYALLEKTLGKDRVYGLHVDHGMMRLNESEKINGALKQIGINDLRIYNAQEEFLDKLKNTAEPEQKRKIIGDLFIEIADRVMVQNQMDQNWLLGQGTIYPDTIESGGTKNADVIKTHHNRVDKIRQMIKAGKIIEPLKDLYKDEVRQIGLQLGLPAELVNRHPFPGPGLGIRCLCSDQAGGAVTKKDNFYQLPIKSVGVQGDERSYAHPALLMDEKDINQAPRLTNIHKEINRVLYLAAGDKEKISGSRLKQAYLTKPRLDLLRQIDEIVNRHILNRPECTHIWQLPVVLIPFGYNHKESVILRPVESEEAMTVSWAKISKNILEKIRQEIRELNRIDFIFYDATNKPPGTIEWE